MGKKGHVDVYLYMCLCVNVFYVLMSICVYVPPTTPPFTEWQPLIKAASHVEAPGAGTQ